MVYIRGVAEQLRRVFKHYDGPAYFKPSNIIKQLLVWPKDKILKERGVGPGYYTPCDIYEASYIGETERSLKSRFMEHRRPSSTTSEASPHIHLDELNHQVDIEKVKILAVEPRWFEQGELGKPSTSGLNDHP